MKKQLLKYGISTAIGAIIVVLVLNAEGLFFASGYPADTVVMMFCDAFFTAGILLGSFGALLWVSTTGFFDAIGYTAKIVGHMFLPFIGKGEHQNFYDYKMAKAEKRGKVEFFLLIVGGSYFAVSMVLLVVWFVIQP